MEQDEEVESVRFHHNLIRYDPHVVAELERWWKAAARDENIEIAHGDALNYHQYCVFYERLVFGMSRLLLPFRAFTNALF